MNPIFSAILGVINGPLDSMLGRFFPSAEKKMEFANELQRTLAAQEGEIVKAAMAAQVAQIEVNKVEAASPSLFVAGWRPAIGWICGASLAWQYVLCPMATWGFAVYAARTGTVFPALPVLETSQLMVVLTGMLGLTAARTVEKYHGIHRDTLE